MIAHYGGASVQGNLKDWNNTTIAGHVSGDTLGNIFFASHILMAAIITFGGILQLVPKIRTRALSFHRWNGRIFLLTAFGMAVGGLYLVWVRGAATSIYGSIAISLNATLIMIGAVMTYREARSRNFVSHRRWALRTFIQVSGVWFFRVGLMGWIFINQGPVGIGEKFDGPFIIFWSFGDFILPLIFLEIYLHIEDSGTARGKTMIALSLILVTCLIAFGSVAAFISMWWPYL